MSSSFVNLPFIVWPGLGSCTDFVTIFGDLSQAYCSGLSSVSFPSSSEPVKHHSQNNVTTNGYVPIDDGNETDDNPE